MQSLEKIRGQLETITELEEITTALEQIAAADMLRVREKIVKSRVFIEETWRIYGILRNFVPINPEVKKESLVLLITLNKGMSGSLVNKVIKVGERLYGEKKADLLITGKKGHNYFAHRDERTIHFFSTPNNVNYEDIQPLRKIVAEYSQVHIVFPRYYSTSQQEVEDVSLMSDFKSGDKEAVPSKNRIVLPKQFQIEPDVQSVVNYFNEAIVGMMVYSYFAEALLAYSAAQMIAMRNAHDNAEEEGKKLTGQFNKYRREIIDTKLRELHKSRVFIKK